MCECVCVCVCAESGPWTCTQRVSGPAGTRAVAHGLYRHGPFKIPGTAGNNNKSSNLARGSRRGAVAHVRPIGPCRQWRAPNSPPKVPFPWTDPLTPPPASSLDPSDL